MKWTAQPPAPTRQSGDREMTADDVIMRLEDAGATMMRMPKAGWSTGARTFWPAVVRDPSEAYGWTGEPVRISRPAAADITAMDEAFGWLAHIPHDRFVLRRVVASRCLVHPITGRHLFAWRAIARMIGSHHMAVQRWHAQGIACIVQGVNQIKRAA